MSRLEQTLLFELPKLRRGEVYPRAESVQALPRLSAVVMAGGGWSCLAIKVGKMPVDASHRTPSDPDGQPLVGDNTSRDDPQTLGNARRLILVAREETALWRYMVEHYGQIDGLQVLLDRRQGERRRQGQSYEAERRIAQRRHPPEGEDDIRHHPFVVITR